MTNLEGTTTPKSDQLNVDNFIGDDTKIIKIAKVQRVNDNDQPTIIYYEGDNGRPYKPCLTMRRALIEIWGKDGDYYIGKSLKLYIDRSVTVGRDKVGGIRISHISHIKEKATVILTVSKGRKKAFTFEVLEVVEPVDVIVEIDNLCIECKIESDWSTVKSTCKSKGYLTSEGIKHLGAKYNEWKDAHVQKCKTWIESNADDCDNPDKWAELENDMKNQVWYTESYLSHLEILKNLWLEEQGI